MLHHEVDKGWVTSGGEPRWRSTEKALERVTGAKISWTTRPRVAHVAHLAKGTPVAVIRRRPAHQSWAVSIEGFEFWGWNRILRIEHFKTVTGFPTIKEARKFVVTVLRQAGGLIA